MRKAIVVGLLGAVLSVPAHAHLMENQQGTLNIVGQRGYLVISLPVSALKGVDDNRDGRLDDVELRKYAGAIERDVRSRLRVFDGSKAAPLDGLLLNLSPDENHREGGPATHLVVLAVAMFPSVPCDPLMEIRIFGRRPGENSYRFTTTRRDAAGARAREFVVRFTEKSTRKNLIPESDDGCNP